MPADFAEHLKEQLTDRWVTVDGSVAELRRFARLTGQVKTVNMNGRALVEFQGTADRGWYDIDPAYLTLVDPPLPPPTKVTAAVKETPATKGGPAAKEAQATNESPASQETATNEVSPVSPVAPANPQTSAIPADGVSAGSAPTESVPRKLSPIELIRARKQAQAAATETPPPVI